MLLKLLCSMYIVVIEFDLMSIYFILYVLHAHDSNGIIWIRQTL